MLRDAVREVGTQKAWAERAGVSEVYVSDVLRKRRPPGDSILRALGLTRRMVYGAEGSEEA